VEKSKRSARRQRRRQRTHLKTVNLLIRRGSSALRSGRMKLTVSDYLRVLGKEIESWPAIRDTSRVLWFDDLDSLPKPADI
jgi:hypothetical protein